ncbi:MULTISPECIES: lipase family protein [Streptomyces]|uniref:lipase family protein n=1 Tax=Streptomyces TaxID=1883 RepID=UPI001963B45D|nr:MULTISPECIES: lipase family protein [Streptomyces]QRX94896.1 lipase family protein [Streptomyces noursei]UJB44603.1 lipase family protein [Streptomyces sp. A1-5]
MTSSPRVDQQATGYSLRQAVCMVRAAELAYQGEQTIEAAAREWGFDRVRHHHTAFRPPFPLQDTQAYTLGGRDMIITAFRGTEPAELRDWLSDATTPPWPGPGGRGHVHYGFAEALESVWPQVLTTLKEFRDNDQALYFTGHSLGGALAMLAGARLHFEDPKLTADGVYTFGQPRTCDPVLAKEFNSAFTDRMYRFVNNNDIVPQLPPEPVFRHVSALRYIDSRGAVHNTMPLIGGLLDRGRGLTADLLAPASDGVRDHFIAAYVTALEKAAEQRG